MTHEFGSETLYWPIQTGDSSRYSLGPLVDFILINGACTQEQSFQKPWQSDNLFWPEDWLLRNFPGGRLLLLNQYFEDPTNIWRRLQAQAEKLLEKLRSFRRDTKIPLVFLCHGLGGYVFMKALKLSSARDSSYEDIAKTTSTAIFFGTPLNNQSKRFRNTLRSCAIVELDLEENKLDYATENVVAELQTLLENMKLTSNFESVGLFEREKSQSGRRERFGGWLPSKKTLVIDEATATLSGSSNSSRIGVDCDHSRIAKLDKSSYAKLLKVLWRTIPSLASQASSANVQPLSNTTTQSSSTYLDASTAAGLSALESVDDRRDGYNSPANLTLPIPPTQSQMSPVEQVFVHASTHDSTSPPISHTPAPPTSPSMLPISSVTGGTSNGSDIPLQNELSHFPLHDAAVSEIPGATVDQSQLSRSREAALIVGQGVPSPSSATQVSSTVAPTHSFRHPKNRFFIGRQDILQEISTYFFENESLPSDMSPPTFTIWGLPGQGKTQTALHFAMKQISKFPSIHFVFAETEHKLLECFSEYAQSMELIPKSSKDLKYDARALMRWYETTDVPWLLVFDNAEDIKLINTYRPQNPRGRVLITSRNPMFAEAPVMGAAASGSELTSMDEDTAAQMLEDQLSQVEWMEFEKAEAKQVVKRVQCLPLAVQASITLLLEARCSMREYNREWSTARSLMQALEPKHVYLSHAKYDNGLSEVYGELYHKLDNDSREMIELFAFLDADNIQKQLFSEGAEKAGLSSRSVFKHRINCFRKLSPGLITQRTNASFQIHRMMQAWIHLRMTQEALQRSFKDVVLLVAKMISDLWAEDHGVIRNEYKEYFSHAEAIHQFYVESLEEGSQSIDQVPSEFLQLLWKAAGLCYRMSFMNTGLKLLRTAEALVEDPKQRLKLSGSDKSLLLETIEIHYCHACIGTEAGDFNMSLEHFQKGLDSFDEAFDKGYIPANYPNHHVLLGGIGNSLNGLGRNIEAEQAFIKCLAEEVTVVQFLPYEVNICRTLLAQAKLQDAERRLENFIERRRRKFGPDDKQSYMAGHALNILGDVRMEQDRKDEAYDLHLRALKCFKQTYGESHHKTGDVYYKVAAHLMRTGFPQEAIKPLKEALRVFQSGTDQSFRKGEIARTTYKMGTALIAAGQVPEGEEHIRQAEEMRRAILGDKYFPARDESAYNQLVSPWAL